MMLKSTEAGTQHIRDRFHNALAKLLDYRVAGLIVLPGRQHLLDSLNMHP